MEAPTVFRAVAANVERPAVGDSSDHRVERQKRLKELNALERATDQLLLEIHALYDWSFGSTEIAMRLA